MGALCRRIKDFRVFQRRDVHDFEAFHLQVDLRHAVGAGIVGLSRESGRVSQNGWPLKRLSTPVVWASKFSRMMELHRYSSLFFLMLGPAINICNINI